MSNSKDIITALSDGDLLKARELVNDDLLSRVAVKIDERSRSLANTAFDNNKVEEVETVNEEEDTEYEKFFRKALKKFGVSDPSEFDSDEKKKEFFDYVDKNYKSDVEKATGKEDPDADDEEKVARDKAKNEEVELDEAVTVDIEFKKDADGAAAVGSETGRKGLVVSGKKVRDKVYKMTFTNDAMMNKFMDKYESKLNEEDDLSEEDK